MSRTKVEIRENKHQESDHQAKPRKKETLKTKTPLRENVEAIVVALILALIVRTFIFQAFKIPSGSMMDTLLVGDHILVNKFIYGSALPGLDISLFPLKEPERRDIIVFKFPKEPSRDFIKRCIAKGDDILQIRGSAVKINHLVQDEPFIKNYESSKRSMSRRLGNRHYNNFGPQKLARMKYFMMGDNRENSQDSRFWGLLDHNLIKGKAFLIYLSIENSDKPIWKKIRWKRFFRTIR